MILLGESTKELLLETYRLEIETVGMKGKLYVNEENAIKFLRVYR